MYGHANAKQTLLSNQPPLVMTKRLLLIIRWLSTRPLLQPYPDIFFAEKKAGRFLAGINFPAFI